MLSWDLSKLWFSCINCWNKSLISASCCNYTGIYFICWAKIADVLVLPFEFCAELYSEELSSFLLINDLNVYDSGFPDFKDWSSWLWRIFSIFYFIIY